MRTRVILLLALAVAIGGTPPAQAGGDKQVLGMNMGWAGFVISRRPPLLASSADRVGTYNLGVGCGFGGVLTPNNTIIVEFGGEADSASLDATRPPQLTYIKCKIKNSFGHETTADLLTNGAASVTAGSTLLDTSGPKEWPVADVTVCASGAAIFGNADPIFVTSPETCQTASPLRSAGPPGGADELDGAQR